MLNQFSNISCYEEFEIQATLTSISKIDILKEIGYKVSKYYVFVSDDGIFNWFDIEGNHIENPGVLKELKCEYISRNITKCIIPNSVISICTDTFLGCKSLKEIIIPNSVENIGECAFLGCKSLEKIVIPDSVTRIGYEAFAFCESLKEVIFKGKTLEEVKQMEKYPFGINDESIIKYEM